MGKKKDGRVGQTGAEQPQRPADTSLNQRKNQKKKIIKCQPTRFRLTRQLGLKEQFSSQNHMSSSQRGSGIKRRSICQKNCSKHLFSLRSLANQDDKIEINFCRTSKITYENYFPTVLKEQGHHKMLFINENKPISNLSQEESVDIQSSQSDSDEGFKTIRYQMPIPNKTKEIRCRHCHKSMFGAQAYIKHVKSDQHQLNWTKSDNYQEIQQLITTFRQNKAQSNVGSNIQKTQKKKIIRENKNCQEQKGKREKRKRHAQKLDSADS